jgi:hypothetical protein
MNFGFDWSERSTKVSVIALLGVAVGGVFIALGDTEKAVAFMGLIVTASGLIGAVVRDKPPGPKV